MAGKPFKFKLPIKNTGSAPVIPVVQNDTNEFTIQLIDNGKPFNLSKATLATYTALKPDGTVVKDKVATIINSLDGSLRFTLDLQCVAMVGTVEMTVEIYEGASRMTTAIFYLEVTRDLSVGADPSSEQSLPVLEALIRDIGALEESIEDAEAVRVTGFNAKIGAVENATALAIEKAGLANQAATAANNKAAIANTAAENADEKAALAATASQNATDAATLAVDKAGLASQKALLAEQNAALADAAAQNAIEKAWIAEQTNTAMIEAENERLARETLATGNAVLATNAANTAANAANTAADLANEKATQAEQTNIAIVGAEASRVTAEQSRADAEGDATKGRVKAENDRATAEQLRATAERNRDTAEQQRVESFQSYDGRVTTLEQDVDAHSETIANKVDKANELAEEQIIISVPNGKRNEFKDGEFKQKVKLIKLTSTSIFLLTTHTNVDTIAINLPSDRIAPSTFSSGQIKIKGYTEYTGSASAVDNVDNINKYAYTTQFSSIRATLIVAKNTYADLNDAKNALAGTEVTYQLATPVNLPLPNTMTSNTREIARLSELTKERKALLTFTDDDGRYDAYFGTNKICDLVTEKNIPYTGFFITSRVDSAVGYMTTAQIRKLKGKGIEILSHTDDHINLSEVTDASTVRSDFEATQFFLDNMGCNISFLAYPFGSISVANQLIAEEYFVGGATNIESMNLNVNNPFNIYRYSSDPNRTLEEWKSIVDIAVERGGWMVITTHFYYENHDSEFYEKMCALVDYAKENGVDIVNFTDGFKMMRNVN